jgi:hypothetical protein
LLLFLLSQLAASITANVAATIGATLFIAFSDRGTIPHRWYPRPCILRACAVPRQYWRPGAEHILEPTAPVTYWAKFGSGVVDSVNQVEVI